MDAVAGGDEGGRCPPVRPPEVPRACRVPEPDRHACRASAARHQGEPASGAHRCAGRAHRARRPAGRRSGRPAHRHQRSRGLGQDHAGLAVAPPDGSRATVRLGQPRRGRPGPHELLGLPHGGARARVPRAQRAGPAAHRAQAEGHPRGAAPRAAQLPRRRRRARRAGARRLPRRRVAGGRRAAGLPGRPSPADAAPRGGDPDRAGAASSQASGPRRADRARRC